MDHLELRLESLSLLAERLDVEVHPEHHLIDRCEYQRGGARVCSVRFGLRQQSHDVHTSPLALVQQDARGTYDPQDLMYTLGKLMIRKLRADWIAQQPGAAQAEPRQYWHDFHDRLMSYTGPLPLIRAALVGEGGSLF